jgi:pimeloyl-ACP methyl ester carboxylesterase
VRSIEPPDRPPEQDEVSELVRLAFAEMAKVGETAGSVHRAVADRTFAAVGPLAVFARGPHDAISSAVYAGVRGAFGLAGRAAGVAVRGDDLSTGPRGALALAVVNGLIGDELAAEGSVLAQGMDVRVEGRPVAPEPAALAEAFPRPSGWLVVFLHGLMESEFAWRLGGRESYGSRLERELGCTAVDIRYNTGLHISENGASLDELLEALVAAWPVDVERIALVGHSMGGLVARSACYGATERHARWVEPVGHIVSLGTPHTGAPLPHAMQIANAALVALPETRSLAALLLRRSAGIRDLGSGSLVDEDWRGRDPDALRAAVCREVPLLAGATHCFVAATLAHDARHPVSRLLGDALVLEASASGRGRTRRIPFREEDGLLLGGAHHLALLNHPAVYERLREWLT